MIKKIYRGMDDIYSKVKHAHIQNSDKRLTAKPDYIAADENNINEQIEYVKEKIAIAERIKEDTQAEIKRHLRIQCDDVQAEITKLIYFCTHLENENNKLNDTLLEMSRLHFDKIDAIKDTLRRLSLIETEMECQVQRLKLKIIELEDMNERQAKFISVMESRFTELGSTTIKELQKQFTPLDEEVRRLETKLFQVKREQEELSSTLQHKERLLKIERTQQESDIKRISANVQFMDDMRKEILEKIQDTKSTVKENSFKEMKKMAKLTEVWRDLAEKHRNLYKDKMQAENENSYLKQKIDKMNDEITLSRDISYAM